MAVKIVFVFILSLLLRASLSSPISLDMKTVQSTDSVPKSELIESNPVLNSEIILRLKGGNKHVQSLTTETLLNAFESFEADHGERSKRDIAKSLVLCPGDMHQYGTRCLTKEEYEYKEYSDGSEGSDDYEEER